MVKKEVVVTGIGVLSPVGVGRKSYWNALCEGKSGVGFLTSLGTTRKFIGSEVPEFNPKDYIKPRKNIKVMSRDIQMSVVSAFHACEDAALVCEGDSRSVDPERMGVVFGCDLIGLELSLLADVYKTVRDSGKSMDLSNWGTYSPEKVMPLWMLKYLPNMPACHIGIVLDARGANNTSTLDRGSSLAALIEAYSVIERGDADVMICGGCGNKVNPTILARGKAYDLSTEGDPGRLPRPYDAERCGTVVGEGAASFVLESKEFALARGAKPLARILGVGRANRPTGQFGIQKESIVQAIQTALRCGDRTVADLDHVNADGMGTMEDAIEAAALREVIGDVPVFSAKGHFGNLGSGTGAVELAASLIGMQKGEMPATLHCDRVADDCPINVLQGGMTPVTKSTFVKINNTNTGRSLAVLFEKI